MDLAKYGFQPLTQHTMPRAGEVVDIERPGGCFSFWHVRVEDQVGPYPMPPMFLARPHNLPPQWMEFHVTDGKFAQSLFYCPAYIRRIA